MAINDGYNTSNCALLLNTLNFRFRSIFLYYAQFRWRASYSHDMNVSGFICAMFMCALIIFLRIFLKLYTFVQNSKLCIWPTLVVSVPSLACYLGHSFPISSRRQQILVPQDFVTSSIQSKIYYYLKLQYFTHLTIALHFFTSDFPIVPCLQLRVNRVVLRFAVST